MRDYTAADYAMLHALETNLEAWSEHFEAPPHPPEPLIYFAPLGLPPILDRYKMSPPVQMVGVPHRGGNLNHQAPA